jgi:hypothetical protein
MDVITYIFIQSSIFLGYWFKPNDFAGREAHYEINMIRSFGYLVDIVTETVPLGEEDLG